MTAQNNQEFQDPALKDAVRRCWACDCASEHLKKQIASLLADGQLTRNTVRRPVMRRSWVLWPLAAAAVIMLCVAPFWHRGSKTRASIIPATVATDLIRTHDHCCAKKNHQGLPVTKEDDAGIIAALHDRLNQPVLVYHPKDPAWQFHGASVCPVGSVSSGHLVYAKGAEGLSIFMLPKSLVPGAVEGAEYSTTVDQHCIVGFVKDGALFCIVSSGPAGTISVDELQQMRSQMEPMVAAAREPESTGMVVAELLRPVR